MTPRRVAVTGLGVVSPHGSNVDTAIDAVFGGISAVSLIELSSDTRALSVPGAIVRDEPWRSLPNLPQPTCDRVSLFALAAAEAAIADAHLELAKESLDRVGVTVGTSLGGTSSQEFAYHEVFSKKKNRLSPFTLVKVMYNGPAAQIGLRFRLGGPSLTYTTTCSSSSVAIGEAMRTIRHGYADVMIAGGSEALFTYVSLIAWQALHVLASPAAGDVSKSCRPFNVDRSGTVLGEGAAFLVLEELERARARRAQIYAELVGYGICNDHAHLTQPSLAAQATAMTSALADANMLPEQIDYLNAHGTGTPLNDIVETRAIKEVFGNHAHKLSISSTKSTHGHLVGAAGALELLISLKSIQRQEIPPTANLEQPDPECDLDYVPNSGRKANIRGVMTNSFAVGGTAAVLIARQYPG
jgi:3-oxoacyl-[acyl-carrier-protein] synthase II